MGVFLNSERQAQAEQQEQPLAVRYEANAETQFGSLSFGQYLAGASALIDRQDQTPDRGESLSLSHVQRRAAYSLRWKRGQ